MIYIRPVSDLKNKFPETEKEVDESTLDATDYMAEQSNQRMTHDEVFGNLRKKIF